MVHIAGKRNVADYFSRVPGYDSLRGTAQLCSMSFTLGVPHGCDMSAVVTSVAAAAVGPGCALPDGSSCPKDGELAHVISVFDDSLFLEHVRST